MPTSIIMFPRISFALCLVLLLANAPAAAQTDLASVRIGENRLDMIQPNQFSYIDGTHFTIIHSSVSGNAIGPVTPVALDLGPGNSSDSGCEASHFAGFPAGNIALIQRGGCLFPVKANNAENAGASGVIIFNRGDIPANMGLVDNFSLGDAWSGSIPVLFTTYWLGEFLAGQTGLEMSMQVRVFRGPRHETTLRYCLAFPDHCALSVRDVTGGWQRDLNPERLHATASTFKTLSLLAYADAVVAGQLNPNMTVSKEEWARFSLRSDGGALANAWDRLGEPDFVTVDQMMNVMMRESDNAAPDWLLNELGQAAFQDVIDNYIDGFHDLPISINSFFARLNGTPQEPDAADRIVVQFDSLDDPGWRAELHALFQGEMQNPAFVASVRDFHCQALPWETPPSPCTFGGQASLQSIRTMLRNHFSRTNTATMLELMAGMLDGSLLSPAVQAVAQPHKEWPMQFSSIAADFSRYGAKGGSFGPQNVCNLMAYTEAQATGQQMLLALFVHDSLQRCGNGLYPFNLIEAMTLDADFRELVGVEMDRIFVDSFEADF